MVVCIAAAIVLLVSACGADDPVDGAADTPVTTMAAGMVMGDDHGDFDFGEAADAANADRVIDLVTKDDFTYTPASFAVTVGETITLRVTNKGKIPHDFTLGRAQLQDDHEIEMANMGGMTMADEANAFMIDPGETKELTWHFTEAGEVLIGCHIPGHYAAGMRATIDVAA